MPSKAKKAASRQAKLRQKKRRGKGGVEAFDPGPTEPRSPAEATAAEVEGESPPARPAMATAAPRRQPSRRSGRGAADEPMPRYQYLGVELRRIGVVTGIILAILAALSFVLGS